MKFTDRKATPRRATHGRERRINRYKTWASGDHYVFPRASFTFYYDHPTTEEHRRVRFELSPEEMLKLGTEMVETATVSINAMDKAIAAKSIEAKKREGVSWRA